MRVTDLAVFRPRTDGRGRGRFRSTWLRVTEEAPRLTFFEHGAVQGWTVTMQEQGNAEPNGHLKNNEEGGCLRTRTRGRIFRAVARFGLVSPASVPRRDPL
jgi:hypothetical protein